ncbi:ComF family protein [Pelagibacterium limicola]|uniref:ComF family protein n=1 Tax=Pelagibacterium limicola TaxID=2791022 RepID=UPI0018AF8306|nr:ComF family protein [Pelagibacterium limicola]
MGNESRLVKASIGDHVRRGLFGLGHALLDGLFPPVCLSCNRAVGTADGLCAACWGTLVPISSPLCPVLGIPFEADMGSGAISPQAIANPPHFDRARSAVAYTDLARGIVAKLKYGDRPELALFCARAMAGAGRELLREDAVLVPVPLHRRRQFSRRYNQSSELARALARIVNCGLDTNVIERHRPTKQQVGLNARQRERNVDGAFRLRPGAEGRLAGRRVVLIDDVLTTGATANAIAKLLKRKGIACVDVLTFARVVFDADMTV